MTNSMKLVIILIVLSLAIGLALPAAAQTATGQKTILQNLAGSPDFSALAGAAKAAGIDGTLGGAGPYTVFAPDNAAFNKIPQGSISALTADKTKLTGLLDYHVVPGRYSFDDLSRISSLQTVDGKTLPVTRNADNTISVGGATVMSKGIDSSNGMLYPVNSVMVPPGFVMPQAAQAPAQGFPWGWLLLGLVVLGALAYLLTRRRRHAEPSRAKYAERAPAERATSRYEEERAHTEAARRPEETMRDVRESMAAYKEPQIADIAKNLNLPLSGMALAGLTTLISKGTFGDKQDFAGFLAKQFFANNMGSALAGGKEPGENLIMDVINKTGIAKGFTRDDTMKMLVPLLITGFMAVYNYLNKKPAVPAR